MIRAVAMVSVLCVAASALGQEVKPPDLSPPDSWEPRQTGTLRIMNKIDSTVQELTLHTGQTVQYESLSVTLTACFVRPPDLPADAAARLTIIDSRPETPRFSGWMLKREPALNMLEHPVYDVQLVGCG